MSFCGRCGFCLLALFFSWATLADCQQGFGQQGQGSPAEGDSGRVPVAEFDAQRNQLRVRAEKIPLRVLLALISQVSGIQFDGFRSGSCDEISVRFDFLPAPEAVAELLRGMSYAVMRDADNQPEKVWVLSSQSHAAAVPVQNVSGGSSGGGSILDAIDSNERRQDSQAIAVQNREAEEFYLDLEASDDAKELAEIIRSLELEPP